MAKPKVKTPRGKKLPQELVDQILRMEPKDLAAEAAREQLSLNALKKQLKDDSEIISRRDKVKELKDRISTFEADLAMTTPVQVAMEKLEEAKEANRDPDHSQAIEDLSQAKMDLKLKQDEWKEDKAKRGATIKLMLKTLKSHLESGTLKTRL